VERFTAEVKTKGGIMIPEKAQGKVHSGVVIAVGPGGRNDAGANIPTGIQAGDKVLLPEYGGQKVEVGDKEYFLFRDTDILAKWSE